ncbi:MAG: phasin [Xanthobacteraceae bacterium]
MSEAIETTKSKSPAARAAFEMPKYELPNFEMPKLEIPAAFRELAEKSVSQAKETYEKVKSAAEQATDVLEGTYATASKGASDYGLKVIEAARENANATFDFATSLMTVKSLAEVVKLSTAHTRKRFEALTAQSKVLMAIAQKTAADTAEPLKESFGKSVKQAS